MSSLKVDIRAGLPAFRIVGLADAAGRLSRTTGLPALALATVTLAQHELLRQRRAQRR